LTEQVLILELPEEFSPMDASATEPDLSSTLSGESAPYVESVFAAYRRDPGAVDARWRAFFDSLALPGAARRASAPLAESAKGAVASEKQAAVSRLLQSTSNRGHLVAKIDPLGLM
jgi:2-oxoglutarate dehydrogenase E1 component